MTRRTNQEKSESSRRRVDRARQIKLYKGRGLSLSRTVIRLSLLLGLALFIFAVVQSGPRQMLAALSRLTALQWAVLAVLRFGYWVLRTFNWRQVYIRYEAKQPFFRLFEARIADNAVGFLTPSAMLGGLPVRAMMMAGVDRRPLFAVLFRLGLRDRRDAPVPGRPWPHPDQKPAGRLARQRGPAPAHGPGLARRL